jgi:glycosyltransferase involved in cell wall biosynthesis
MPTIAYMLQYFPYMTETFVYREVQALREQGFDVVTLSNRRPNPAQLSAESRPLMDATEYVFPVQWGGLVAAHLRWLVRAPRRYLGTAWRVFGQRGESLDNRRRTLQHWLGAVWLAERVRERGIQHIHAHFSVNAATMALVIAGLLGIDFSFTVHNNIFTDRLILREKLRSARAIVSISEFSREWLLRYAPEIAGLREKFEIVRCGIAPEQFEPQRERGGESADSAPPLIFSLANHAERKGMPYLVEACRILCDRGTAFRCVIGGQGDETALLREMIGRYHLETHVSLPGVIFQEQLRPWLHQAAIFTLPCITAANGDIDGIPVVLMEAMAMELPCVSTTVSGIPELIQDGANGLLVPEKNAAALADALERLLDDPALATRLARAGRESVQQGFNIHTSAGQLGLLFNRILSRSAPVEGH